MKITNKADNSTSAPLQNKIRCYNYRTRIILSIVILTVLANILVACTHRKISRIISRKLFTIAGFVLFEAHKNKTGSLSLSRWSFKEMI